VTEFGSSVTRSEPAAKAAVAESYTTVISQADDSVRELVTEGLIAEIFDYAWQRQFDEDQSVLKKTIQQIVQDRIEESLLEREEGGAK
jgi:hypothetical protein